MCVINVCILFLRKAMATVMDESIGNIVNALKDNDMYDNTIIVFTSDVSICHIRYNIAKCINSCLWPQHWLIVYSFLELIWVYTM
jgi:hypothetical protein